MSIPTKALITALQTHAAASGHFETVNGHEAKSAPGAGLSCSIWVQTLRAAQGQSGLANTTMHYIVRVRVYTPMLAEPADDIDPRVMDAVDQLMSDYSGHFTLGGIIRNIDLLGGQTGEGMGANAGYTQIGQTLVRIVDIDVPMILNDVYTQTP